ncbi:uncharacterized protein LOC113517565 [Galleria mellonella]|uniref:Uncharacterized protein LOC113517565 n=1 Tax=Galleria mellonella TaxID=7137 RepID=A0A6J3C4P2_GALME|nr:uncharacterized protein LOC113517565 [Galleria mellonella]
MKLLVICLMIIANIINNGKASLETFKVMSDNWLLEDNTKSPVSCYRPCKFNVEPRFCRYTFEIEPTMTENGKTAITINGKTPGPPINVCVNDFVVVKVKNKIPDQDIAIHWHGVEQVAPHMDGVPMITQCPISYGSTYTYIFNAISPGTFFYHADSVSHHSDGVYGSFVVNQPQPLDHHSALYDYDRSPEYTLLVGARFPMLFTANLEDMSQMAPDALVINGDEDSYKLFVMQGYAYRLRLINAIAIECPVVASIEGHEMTVIATDGKAVKPVSTRSVQLYPGERMDVVVRASQENGGYWLKVHGIEVCAGLTTDAMLIYSGFNYTSMLQNKRTNLINTETDKELGPPVYGQMLESKQNVAQSTPSKTVYLSIDRKAVKHEDNENDFRYISEALPNKPFFPAALSLQDSVVQINGKSFLYPAIPAILSPRYVKLNYVCPVGEEDKSRDPQCVQILTSHEGAVVELVLLNEGFGSNDSYTFHLHGFTMQVVATWQSLDKKPISLEEFKRLDKEKKVIRNLINPPVKDTVTVPNKGYTVVRMRTDLGGSWMLECRACSLSSLPTAILLSVPRSLPLPEQIIKALSLCGNYKPPDVLLN